MCTQIAFPRYKLDLSDLIEHFGGIKENHEKSRKIEVGDQRNQCYRVGRYMYNVYMYMYMYMYDLA